MLSMMGDVAYGGFGPPVSGSFGMAMEVGVHGDELDGANTN